MRKPGRHLRHFVYPSLTRKQDGGRQHALKKLRACALVYPANTFLGDDGTQTMQGRAIALRCKVPGL